MRETNRRNSLSLAEFLAQQNGMGRHGGAKPRRAKRIRPTRPKRPKSTAAVLLRGLLLLICVGLLCTLTFGGAGLQELFERSVRSNSVVAGPTQTAASVPHGAFVTSNKPAFPGCTTGSFRRQTAQQVASRVRPSVVGIIQYRAGSLRAAGEGSGIVMSSDGYIVTNNHVVDGASRLVVVLSDGSKLAAKVLGTDERTDLAVVKVDAKNLTAASFGNSDQCAVGEEVLAVGNPSGLMLAGSVTQGIVSAINRNVDVGNGPMSLIQTDAAINPGNSGGALVNLYGQVVGINSAKIAQSGYEGIGFSIPVNTAAPVVDSLIRYGCVQGRVKFGFNCRELDEITAQSNGLPAGLYVDYVDPTSDASKSGLLADDIVTAMDGAPVKTTDAFITARDAHKPGDEVTLAVYRRKVKQSLTLRVRLMQAKSESQTLAAGTPGKETYY